MLMIKIWLLFYQSQHSAEDLPTLVNELYCVGKYFMFLKKPFASRVGGLYLLYALYFTQPTRYIIYDKLSSASNIIFYTEFTRNKIHFTLSEVKDLVSFLDLVKQGNMYEPLFTFYKLFVKNAFIFVVTPNQVFFWFFLWLLLNEFNFRPECWDLQIAVHQSKESL